MHRILANHYPLLVIICLAGARPALAQAPPVRTDTTSRYQRLDEVSITGAAMHFAPLVDGTTLTAGRRNELIRPREVDANLATNNVRQILGRVPGLMVWENDNSGQQVNVGTRGLSPNRSWEFNVRQNGYDIAPDPFGYPEAYYNPPLEAVERIQLLRGGAGLQFGPQFGGLLNYELRRGAPDRKLTVETSNTGGSRGLFNTYNAVGGTLGKLTYYTYYRYRRGDGWRQNNGFQVHDAHANVQLALTERLTLGTEVTYMTYRIEQPGGLTDAQFSADPRQSVRARNWFGAPWLVPALTLNYRAADRTRLALKAFGLVAERNSVGVVSALTVPDTVSRATGQYAARQVDRDLYRSLGAELRLTHELPLIGEQLSTLAAGARVSRGTTERLQRGRGTTAADFDLSLTGNGRYGAALDNSTLNAAAFAELLLRPLRRLSLTPGVRYEHLRNAVDGYLSVNADGTENRVRQRSNRNVVLYGLGAEYQLTNQTNLYANYSRAYRPVLFSDLLPPATTDLVDPNLRDANGYTAEIGYRGNWREALRFDVGYFYLYYADRIGLLRRPVPGGAPDQTQQVRTNLGTSRSHGLEAYAELDVFRALAGDAARAGLAVFGSLSLLDARYTQLPVYKVTGTGSATQIEETNLKNQRVEYAPRTTLRTGLTFTRQGFSATGQISRVAAVYADATNTDKPTANGQLGRIPAYTVTDLSATWRLGPNRRYRFSGGINNLLDRRYFTRRAGGYPGPGLLPADGRTWYVGLGLMI